MLSSGSILTGTIVSPDKKADSKLWTYNHSDCCRYTSCYKPLHSFLFRILFGKLICIPYTFKLSNTVAIFVSKTAAKDQKWGAASRSPFLYLKHVTNKKPLMWAHTKGNVLGWCLLGLILEGKHGRVWVWTTFLITNVLRMTECSLMLGVVLLVLVIVI